MFKIKRADGYPFETMVYGVKEVPDERKDYKLKFLIYYKEKWDWVYAKDFIPVSEELIVTKSIPFSWNIEAIRAVDFTNLQHRK